jgi:hypothetical protein
MRHAVAAVDDRPRHSGGGCTLGKQTPRLAAMASEIGQNRTNASQHVGAEDGDKPQALQFLVVQKSRISQWH